MMGIYGEPFVRFEEATQGLSSLMSAEMPRRDSRWSVMLRVNTASASSQYSFCFEWKQLLLRVETASASSRITLW
jgi:hypothetical protein